MNTSTSLLLAAFILIAALTVAQENKPKPPATFAPPDKFATTAPNTTTTTGPTTTTTTSPTTTTTTTPPTTTTTATTTTTTPPTTTTTATTTTTTPPTTTTTTTTTTTAVVTNSTTTIQPTTQTTTITTVTTIPTTSTQTTPQPGPTPGTNLTLGNYTITDKSKNLCLMIQAAVQVNINNTHANGTFVVQPKNTQTAGSCQDNTAEIQVRFQEGNFSLIFIMNVTTNTIYVNYVNLSLTYYFKSGALYDFSKENNSVQLFSTAPGHSYSCKSESIFLGDGIYLEFSQERLQAFNLTNSQFGPVDLCQSDQPNYSVAITVGVILIILIVIVLIAYFISRKKRTDGYQTL